MFSASPQSRVVSFSWRPVEEQLQNGMITNYTITCTPHIAINIHVNTDTDMFSVTHHGFTPATQYSCSIVALNLAGSGPAATLTFTTLDVNSKNCLFRTSIFSAVINEQFTSPIMYFL